MGPQLDSCGRVDRGKSLLDLGMLQWGRNLIVAEGRLEPPGEIAGAIASMGPQLDSCGRLGPRREVGRMRTVLQWGRNLIVAEGGTGGSDLPTWKCFNGAAT